MEPDDDVFQGSLLVPSGGKKIGKKKSWQQKYCYLYKASKFGIKRLEIWDSADKSKSVPFKIITLENCVKITPDGSTFFTITTKTEPSPYEFNAPSSESKAMWLSALQSVAFPDDSSILTSIEDNDLYCSSGEGVFNVTIHPSIASERCGLKSDQVYTLVLTSNSIQLQESCGGKLLYTWPYLYIRRYGHKNAKFTFEAGRMCKSGEGIFYIEHPNQQEIFRNLSLKMSAMKKRIREESVTSSQILNCGDNQLHTALSNLSMEARSRSPLPPSVSTSLGEVDCSTENSMIKPNIGTKPKPIKPPRKCLPKSQENSFSSTASSVSDKSTPVTYEIYNKYDKVQYRNDAWRTMGVDDIKHSENDIEDEMDVQWSSQKNTTATGNAPNINKTTKIIMETNQDDNSYDKLNHFGSSTKLNINPGYKQISLTSGSNVVASPTSNDYDEVQPTFQGIRLADDSHLGYAVVRKEGPKETNIDHHIYNNEPYAVISKPKRV